MLFGRFWQFVQAAFIWLLALLPAKFLTDFKEHAVTPEQNKELIRLLEKGEDISPEWARILFPPEKREYELVYHGKDREEDIIADTLAVPLQPVRTFGRNGVDWHNKLIFGDNLQTMKTLLEKKQAGMLRNADGTDGVRLVYIDPPFATQRDFRGTQDQKAYQDKIAGAQFIEFLRRRLVLIRELLSEDGSVFVHLDQRKAHYVKVILDEVFGEEHFSNEIIWRSTNTHNTKTSIGQIHQVIFYYTKSDRNIFNPIRRPHFKEHVDKNYRYHDENGACSHCDLTGPGVRAGDSGKAWKGYNPTASGRHWQPPSALYDQLGEDISQLPMLKRLDFFKAKGFVYFPSKGGQPRGKLYLDPKGGNLVQDLWAYQPYTSGVYEGSDDCIDEDVQWLQNPEGGIEYPTQKPEGVLSRIMRVASNEGDIVLDCFAGSGTTLAVAEKLKRRWIGIDCGKLSIYAIQKRFLNLCSGIGNTGTKLEATPFTLYNAGLYDFSALKELTWPEWRFFALQLFDCRDEPHKISGIHFDGYRQGQSVIVFNHMEAKHKDARISEDTIQEIHDAVGSRVGSKVFIIAPALAFDFQQDYIDIDRIRYYALRIPYSIINELHRREFSALKQPSDEMAVNDTVEAVGFDFIHTPDLKIKAGVEKPKGELFQVGILKVETFKSQATVREPFRKRGNLETLSMVMLDFDYDEEGKVFDLDAVYYADALAADGWKIRFPVEILGKKMMAVFVDIYGNEARVLLDTKGFGKRSRKTGRKI